MKVTETVQLSRSVCATTVLAAGRLKRNVKEEKSRRAPEVDAVMCGKERRERLEEPLMQKLFCAAS